MKETQDFSAEVKEMAQKAKRASHQLAQVSTEQKNKALFEMAEEMERSQDQLIAENQKDLGLGEKVHLSPAMMDRLRLTPSIIQGMAEGLREVARLPYPV